MLRAVYFLGAVALALSTKPHVFLIVGDDIGHYNVGYHGNTEAKTPHIDALATEGAKLERMYAYFWCSPSRASIMSGRLPVHMYQTRAPQASEQDGLPLAATTLAEKMRAAGYATVQAGKWHLGSATPGRMPTARGFDSSLGFSMGAENHFNQSTCSDGLCLTATGQGVGGHLPPGVPKDTGMFDLWHNGTLGTFDETGADKGFGDDRWTNHVIAAVNGTAASGKPLFAYLTLAAAHTPLQAPASALAPFPADMYHDRRLYNGLMTQLDANIGRLVAAIKAQPGMWENSLLFFVSDNGGPIYWNQPLVTKLPGLNTGGGANNYPLTGGKLSMLEGGHRVVSFAAGGALPAAARGQAVDQLMAIADLHATAVDAAGGKLPDPRGEAAGIPPVDGVSLMPVLAGGPGAAQVRTVLPLALNITQNPLASWGSALIVNDLKLILGDQRFYVQPNKTFPTEDYPFVWDDAHTLKCGTTGCLFNLTADSAEQHDLAASRPDLLASMMAHMEAEKAKQYERPTGQVSKLKMIAALVKNKGCMGPFADDEPIPSV